MSKTYLNKKHHLIESDCALTTDKWTKVSKESSKGIKDLSASDISHVLMICSLIEHGFLSVFSIE